MLKERISFLSLLSGSLFIAASLVSCREDGPGFHPLKEGIEHRKVTLGTGTHPVGMGDGVGIVYRMTPRNEPAKTWARDTAYFLLDQKGGVWLQMLNSMVVEDSSIFLVDRGRLRKGTIGFPRKKVPDSVERVRTEVKLLEKRKPSALMEWKEAHGASMDQQKWKEWKRIRDFVSDLAPDPDTHFVEGIYLFRKRMGRGPRVKMGREIALHYKGFLPDSTVFDDSYKRGEPLRFRYGAPDQVIRGIEIGLKYMRQGGKAELVIPSYLAFGKKGGETGILPPHTFVYYKIEVIDVKIS